jgi:uncharacterized protein (DUF849 family)
MMNSIAVAFGGGVRVGLEDNIWYDNKRSRLAQNIDLIRRIHTLADANERKIMPPSEFSDLRQSRRIVCEPLKAVIKPCAT